MPQAMLLALNAWFLRARDGGSKNLLWPVNSPHSFSAGSYLNLRDIACTNTVAYCSYSSTSYIYGGRVDHPKMFDTTVDREIFARESIRLLNFHVVLFSLPQHTGSVASFSLFDVEKY